LGSCHLLATVLALEASRVVDVLFEGQRLSSVHSLIADFAWVATTAKLGGSGRAATAFFLDPNSVLLFLCKTSFLEVMVAVNHVFVDGGLCRCKFLGAHRALKAIGMVVFLLE